MDDILFWLHNMHLGGLVRFLLICMASLLVFYGSLYFVVGILHKLWLDIPCILTAATVLGLCLLDLKLKEDYDISNIM